MDKVSIIMPVRNALPYLSECMESIISQTYTDFEVHAIDDHSTDGSHKVLYEFAQKDKRINIHSNSGRGIIDALITGYNASTGNFVTRMDADDIMPLNKLEILIGNLRQKGPGYVATGLVKYISTTTLGDGFKRYEVWLNELCRSNNHYEEIYKECVIPSPCWMMSRKDFESIGGFDEGRYPEDYDLCFRMYKKGIKVSPSQQVLHVWRDHGARASRNDENYSDNRFLELKVDYFVEIEQHLNSKLVLWGAGKKGKNIAKLLKERNIEFAWITDNTKKIGKHINDTLIQASSAIFPSNEKMSLILAVANPLEQKELIDSLERSNSPVRIYKFC